MSIIEFLREMTVYNPEDGKLYWKQRPRYSTVQPGDRVGGTIGYLEKKGYQRVTFCQEVTYMHRLVYMYHHGEIQNCIMFLDGNPSNTRIENLRDVTRSVAVSTINRGRVIQREMAR